VNHYVYDAVKLSVHLGVLLSMGILTTVSSLMDYLLYSLHSTSFQHFIFMLLVLIIL